MRLSGPRAVSIAGVLLRDGARITALASHRLSRVALIDPADGAPLDEALVVVMRAPRSYTGEDVVELSCHGSPAVLRTVAARLRDAGARLAEPGEFTRRAYLNGRMDLARAEAVALLVSARTERAARLAARALTEFGDEARRVRDPLLDVVAGLEVRLDFPEDDLVAERVGADGDEGGLVSSLRQLEIFETLVAALRRGATALTTAPLEVALVDLREALGAVSDLLGIEVGDAVLDRVFANFCLGK